MQEKREKESERELLGVSIGFRGRERNVRWRKNALLTAALGPLSCLAAALGPLPG